MSRFALAAALSAALSIAPVSIESAWAQVDDYKEIEFPELASFVIPAPEVYELSNGMKVFLLEDHELPLVQITARVRTGSVYEPDGKTGLASLAGTVQRTGGTRSMNGDEIDDFLEARAASVETGISSTVGFATMDSLSDDVAEVLPIFVEVLRFPEFAEEKLQLAKVQANSGISRRNDSVGSITSREFNRLVYGSDSAMGRMAEYATIDGVTREDLVAWHARYYHPNNIYIGVVGDFDSAEMKKMLEEAFGDWSVGPAADPSKLELTAEDRAGVYFIEKSDVTQANIRLGHLGITYDNPDYFPVVVMNEVLGGGFSARLFSRIRSQKGLAYSVGGRVGAGFLYEGLTSFGMQTKSETMGEAVDALFGEVRGMITEPASERELQLAKDAILNSFIFNYASKGQVLGQQMLFSYYGLPSDFLEKYRTNIEKVTGADVQRVAEKYLKPDQATLLVVGRAEDFDRPVSSFGEMTELDISIPPPPSKQAAVEVTEESRAAGAEILDRMAATVGGANRGTLEAFRTLDKVVVNMQGQTMEIQQEFVLQLPDQIRVTLRLPMGEQVMLISEGRGYQMMGGQSRELGSDQVERQLADIGRNMLYLAQHTESPELQAVAAGREDGAGCDWVQVEFGSSRSRLCVDGDGKVVKQTYQGVHPFTGAPGNFEISYSDYRDVGGSLLPFGQSTRIDGVDFAMLTREDAEVNPEVDPALFEKPAA